MKKAVIVIPTYNEAKNVEKLVEKIEEAIKKVPDWKFELLFVDSFSPDGTASVIKKLQKKHTGIHLLEVEKKGLGMAYSKGFEYATSRLSPYVLFEMDADLSHDSKAIPAFIKKIEEGNDFVIGSRYIKGGSIPKDWGFHRKIFSVLGNIVIRLGFMKLKVTDWTSGYRAIKVWIVKDALPHIQKYSGYVFQVAFLDFALKKGAKVSEVPINFTDRLYGLSKINSLQYIFQTLLYTFFYSSFVRYILVGTMGFAIDFGISYLLIERVKTALWLATLISAELAIISNFIWNNFWSFSHKKLNATFAIYINKFIKFNIVSSGGLIIQATGIELLAFLFGSRLWFVYKALIIVCVVIPYSYTMYNRVIWKDKK